MNWLHLPHTVDCVSFNDFSQETCGGVSKGEDSERMRRCVCARARVRACVCELIEGELQHGGGDDKAVE